MADLSNYAETASFNHILRATPLTSPATIYMRLFNTDPTDAATGTEVTGGGYAAEAITMGADTNGVGTNSVKITFTTATSDWDTINYLAVYLDSIQKNITSFAGRRLSFNNIKTSLDEFRNHTERQLFRAFKITINPNEEIGRRLLQTHLQAAFSRRVFQFSEVQVASGKSDNLLIMNETKYPFEAKLWKGQKYYEKGLGQIKYYMNYENVKYGFYVIFDTRKRDYRSGGNIIEYNSKKIYELFIHINLRAP